MEIAIGYLRQPHTKQAALLDRTWFGDHAISKEELDAFIQQYPNRAIAVLGDDILYGFATFEVVEDGQLPKNYQATQAPSIGRLLFIQQFTTTQNYSGDMKIDEMLLNAVEVMAKKINCSVVSEALAIDHPYKKERNNAHDVFGFYKSHGYLEDQEYALEWKPEGQSGVKCTLLYKKIDIHI